MKNTTISAYQRPVHTAQRINPTVNHFVMTNVFFLKEEAGKTWVYLAIKRDKIGKGKRMAYGGRKEQHETLRTCAIREVREESGGVIIDPRDLLLFAAGDFTTLNRDHSEMFAHVYFFMCSKWTGVFKDTEEAWKGEWFPIENLPAEDLMAGDKKWLQYALCKVAFGYKSFFEIEARYGPDQQYLLDEQVIVRHARRPLVT